MLESGVEWCLQLKIQRSYAYEKGLLQSTGNLPYTLSIYDAKLN
jgi:hypothetical protein